MATTESSNFYRMASLLLDGGTKVLKKLFTEKVNQTGQDLNGFLASNIDEETGRAKVSDKSKKKKRRFLNTDQLDVLFPPFGDQTDIEEWDLTLLACLLGNVCSLSANEFSEVDNLREYRNFLYGHSSEAKLGDSTFQNCWAAVSSTITNICNIIGDVSFQKEILDFIKEIETCPLSLKDTSRILSEWHKCIKDVEDRLGKMEKTRDDIEQRMKTIESNQNEASILSELEDLKSKLKKYEEVRLETEQDTIDRIQLRKYVDRSKKRLARHSIHRKNYFVETKIYKEASVTLSQEGMVVIEGIPGSGKSYTAMSLLEDVTSDNNITPIIIDSVKDVLDLLAPEIHICFFIDDFTGKFDVSQSALRSSKSVLTDILPLIEDRKISLIITVRRSILRKLRSLFTRVDAIAHLLRRKVCIDISEIALQKSEKCQMLLNYVKYHKFHPTEKTLSDVVKMEDKFGFPLLCKLLPEKYNQSEILQYFMDPKQVLVDEIELLFHENKQSYVVLVLTLFNNGTLLIPNVTKETFFTNVVNFFGLDTLSPSDIHIAAHTLEGTFLYQNKTRKSFGFTHDSIEEVVFLSFSNKCEDNLMLALTFCHIHIITKLCVMPEVTVIYDRTGEIPKVQQSSYEDLSHYVVISPNAHTQLKCRYLKEIQLKQSYSLKAMADSEVWGNKNFVNLFFSNCLNLLEEDENGSSILVHAANSDNYKLVDCICQSDAITEDNFQNQVEEALVVSCQVKSSASTKLLLKHCRSVPIHAAVAAAKYNNIHAMDLFVNSGLDLTISKNGNTLLHFACKKGNLEMVKYLVHACPPLLTVLSKEGNNPVHYASLSGNIELINFLVICAIDIYAVNKTGETALHKACEKGNLELSHYLVSTYPDLLEINETKKGSLLHSAASGGKIEIFNFLKEQGVTVIVPTSTAQTPLHHACRQGHFNMSSYLVRKYPDFVSMRDKNGTTALHEAAAGGALSVLKLLEEYNADVHVSDKDGETPLHAASRSKNEDIVNYLIRQYPALLFLSDKQGWTPAHFAAFGKALPILFIFEENGVSLLGSTITGMTPLFIACQQGAFETTNYLISHHPELLLMPSRNDQTPAHAAAFSGDVSILKLLEKAGMNLAISDLRGKTPLHVACEKGHYLIANYLACKYPELLYKSTTDNWTPALYAARGGNLSVLQLLEKKGLSMVARGSGGENPLHIACVYRHYEIVKYLLSKHSYLLNMSRYDKWTLAHSAAYGGNVSILKLLVKSRLNINVRNSSGGTPLSLACEQGHYEMSKYLISHYPTQLKCLRYDNWTLAHCAAYGGEVSVLKLIKENGLAVDIRDSLGATSLHLACERGHYGMAKYLVSHHPALLDIPRYDKWTVAHAAACGGNVSILKLLEERKINVAVSDRIGATPLMLACQHGHYGMVEHLIVNHSKLLKMTTLDNVSPMHTAAISGNIPILQLLKRSGCKVVIKGCEGKTPLHVACEYGRYYMTKHLISGNPELLQMLDDDGWTPVHSAGYGGNVSILKLLENVGMSVTIKSHKGETALHLACEQRRCEMVNYLISRHSELLQMVRHDNWTPVHSAAYGGLVRILKLLEKNGLKVNITSSKEVSPLHLACEQRCYEMSKYLISQYPALLHVSSPDDWTPVHSAASGGYVSIMQLLINSGLNITAGDKEAETPLNVACESGHYDMANYLITKQPDLINRCCLGNYTPVHSAARGGYLNILQLLEKSGSKVAMKTDKGKTPLHIACKYGNYEVSQYLILEHSELLDVTDINNWTPMHFAAFSGNVSVLQLLVASGLSLSSIADDGETPLHLACKEGHLEMVNYLLTKLEQQNMSDPDKYASVHAAIIGGNVSVLQALEQAGYNVNTKTKNKGKTPLNISCEYGKYEVARYLIREHPELLYISDDYNWTPVHSAACGGNLFILELLTSNGCNITEQKEKEETPLHIACEQGHYEMANYLVSQNPDLLQMPRYDMRMAVHSAAYGGNLSVFKLLETEGLEVIVQDAIGATPLHLACEQGNTEMAIYLASEYPKLLGISRYNKWTPLHSAAYGGDLTIFQVLEACQLSLSVKDTSGETTLHLACRKGHYEIVEYIIMMKPDQLEISNYENWTCVHAAAVSGKMSVLHLLEESGCKFDVVDTKGKTPLHIACECRNYEISKYLMSTYAELLEVSANNNWKQVHSAAYGGDVAIMQLFERQGLDVTSLNNLGETALHLACEQGNIEMTNYLIYNYPNLLQIYRYDRWTPVHSAAYGGKVPILHLLESRNMSMNVTNKRGETPLHLACEKGHLDVVDYIITKQPEQLQIVCNDKWSPVHSAAYGGNVQVIQYLEKKGCKLLVYTKTDKTPLHFACEKGHLKMTKYLVSKYPDLHDMYDSCNWNQVFSAAYGGNVQILLLLKQKGLEMSIRGSMRETALHLACEQGHYEMSNYLQSKNPELLHIKKDNLWTPLHSAAYGGNVTILKLLINKGLEVTTRGSKGETALHIACDLGHYEMACYLQLEHPELLQISDSDKWTPVHNAANGGNVSILQLLVSSGLPVVITGTNGETPLHCSSARGYYEMTEYLLSEYPELLFMCDNDNWTPMHSAAWGGNVSVLQLLKNAGLKVITTTSRGETPLHLACQEAHHDMTKHLISEHGELLHMLDEDGWTPMHYAASGGDVDILQYFEKEGLDVTTKGATGETLLHIACEEGHYEMVFHLLLEHPDLLGIPDEDKWTPVHSAAYGGNLDILKSLEERGMQLFTKSKNGETPLIIALNRGNKDIENYLTTKYPELSIIAVEQSLRVCDYCSFV